MTIQEKYIELIKSSLSIDHNSRRPFRDGYGYIFACPFCGDLQKRQSKKDEKCARFTPIANSFQWNFLCHRGLQGSKRTTPHCRSMRFDYFLKEWNPPLYRQYLRDKGTPPPKMNYTPKFDR